jgi:hypothetical protein
MAPTVQPEAVPSAASQAPATPPPPATSPQTNFAPEPPPFVAPASAPTAQEFAFPKYNDDPPPVAAPISPDRDENVEPFAHEPPFRPRKNPTKRWTLAALLACVLMVVGIGTMQLLGTPNFLAKWGLPVGQVDIPLEIKPKYDPERRTMPNGNELLSITGQIYNPTAQEQRVPDIIAELQNAQGNIIFTFPIQPPLRTIGPKATIDFNGAALDVPKGAASLDLSFSGS